MFGFPSYSRPENFHFGKNFLRSVTIQIKYAKNGGIIGQKAKLVKLLSEKFPNNQDLQSNSIQIKNVNNKTEFLPKSLGVSGIMFQTKDTFQSINISENFIVINIDGSVYTNMETLWKDIEKELTEVLSICQIKELNWVSIRKINLIQFELKEDVKPLEGIAAVFNNALISNFLSIPGSEFLYNGISNIALKNGNHNLNLTLGLIPSVEAIKNLMLDIDLFYLEEKIPISSLKDKLFEINQEMFNIFNWCLHDNTIKQLKN